jgi:hypothetical protein
MYFSQGTLTGWGEVQVHDVLADIATAFGECASYWIPELTATIEPTGTILDSATGEIITVYTDDDPPDPIDSEGVHGINSRATQILLQLRTGVYLNGRELRGRMFFGPAASGVLGEDGLVTGGVQDQIETSFGAINTGTGARWCVWHRPSPPSSDTGTWEDIKTVQVSQEPAVLRGRRD